MSLLAATFAQAGVAAPRTHLLDEGAAVERLLQDEPDTEWVLKSPTAAVEQSFPGASRARNLKAPAGRQGLFCVPTPEAVGPHASRSECFSELP